jgi:hypothetical protein
MTLRDFLSLLEEWFEHYFEVLFWQVNWLDAHLSAVVISSLTYIFLVSCLDDISNNQKEDHNWKYRHDQKYRQMIDEQYEGYSPSWALMENKLFYGCLISIFILAGILLFLESY